MFHSVARPAGLTFVVTLLLVVSVTRAISIPSDADHVRSLDGTWRFKFRIIAPNSGPLLHLSA